MNKVQTIDTHAPLSFEVEKLNPLFSKAKIYVMYHGRNRNDSFISKEAVERALPTMKNIPIVGEFQTTETGEGNFKGHGGKLEITDTDIRFLQTTSPIGVIPESATVSWQTVTDEKDQEREYLVVDGAYLWNRYEDEVMAMKQDNFGQSMEIEVTQGDWNDEEDLYDIQDFIFSAFCILGIDKNGSGHVEPAFEDAKIITYSLDKDAFKEEFTQLLSELTFSLEKEEGDRKGVHPVLNELLIKYSLTMEDLTEKGIDPSVVAEDELEAVLIDAFNIEPAPVSDPEPTEPEEPSTPEEPEGSEEPTDEPDVEPEPEPEADPEADEPVEDEPSPDTEPDVEPADEPDVEPEGDPEPAEPVEEPAAEPENTEPVVDQADTIRELEAELTDVRLSLASLTDELNELRAFKADKLKEEHEQQAIELFHRFDLNEDDVKDVDIYALSIQELEEKCYALVGRKMLASHTFAKAKKDDSIRLPIEKDTASKSDDSPYGDLFERYTKK